jgi:hypothetical protein
MRPTQYSTVPEICLPEGMNIALFHRAGVRDSAKQRWTNPRRRWPGFTDGTIWQILPPTRL